MVDALGSAASLLCISLDVSVGEELFQNWIDGSSSGPPRTLRLVRDLLEDIVAVGRLPGDSVQNVLSEKASWCALRVHEVVPSRWCLRSQLCLGGRHVHPQIRLLFAIKAGSASNPSMSNTLYVPISDAIYLSRV